MSRNLLEKFNGEPTMNTKIIISIAALSLSSIAGTANASIYPGGTGEYGDLYSQADPGQRSHPVASANSASDSMGRAAFGTRSGARMHNKADALQFDIAYLGGVGAYGDIYPLADPGQRAQ